MASDDTEQEQSPFTRPGFFLATGAVGGIAVLGIVLGIMNLNDDEPDVAVPTPTEAPSSSAPASEPSSSAETGSVCGLPGEAFDGTVSTPPEAQWEFQDTTGYPTSDVYGPADTNSDGVRFCFQHTPDGALFAAANAVVQGANPQTVGDWLDYFIADGPNREAVVSSGPDASTDGTGTRVEIAGFRMLAYDGDSARVDVAVQGSATGRTVSLSMVYDLVWQDGDWKLEVTNPNSPIDVANIPDVAGYTSWGA